MTREEAIRIIRKMLACTDLSVRANLNADMVDACHMAIKALEQEPCADAISRQVVLEVLKDKWGMFSDANDAMQESIDTIEALSNVSPQPKTGHWIMTGDYYTGAYGTIDYVECSCCHEDSLEEGNYCPNCGAKMVEPQESEE